MRSDEKTARYLIIGNQIRQHLIRMGYACTEPFDITDEEYGWSMAVGNIDTQKAGGIDFHITESKVRDGSDDGIGFFLHFGEWGGRILGDYCPYNYTPQVWVDPNDEDAVEERFAMYEDPNLDLFDDDAIARSFRNSWVEQILIDGRPPAHYGYDWIVDGCAMHQWCSGAKALSQELLDHIDHLITGQEQIAQQRADSPDPQAQIDNLTALRDYLSSQLLQPQEA